VARGVLFRAGMRKLLLIWLLSIPALAQSPEVKPPGDPPELRALLETVLSGRPELRQSEAAIREGRERAAQAGTLQDPVLTLGIQNDGFKGIEIGTMETSFLQVMVTQPLPWPGKRSLRTAASEAQIAVAQAQAQRVRLSLEAQVRRAYLELLLVRERLALLARLEGLWTKAEGLARIRYESAEGAQSDILRAQLERNRLRQRRSRMEAEQRTRLSAVNRWRQEPFDAPFETRATVASLGLPPVPALEEALADAEKRSPELLAQRLSEERAVKQVALLEKEKLPDFAVSAGIMPRGGLAPMWTLGLSFNLPVFLSSKQSRAVAEGEARKEQLSAGTQALLGLLRLRVQERVELLASVLDSEQIYREGLLIQSRATADATLSQYRVGRVTFASVLEEISGVIGDEEGYLQTLVQAQRLAIAAGEVSLEAAGGGSEGMGGASVPGAGASGGGAAAGGAPSAAAPADSSGGGAGGAAMGKM
jgi:outer membrane protein, heavy metal efflux system